MNTLDAIDLSRCGAVAAQYSGMFLGKAPAGSTLDIGAVLAEEIGCVGDHDWIGILPFEKLKDLSFLEEQVRTEGVGGHFGGHPSRSVEQSCDQQAEYSSRYSRISRPHVEELAARADEEFRLMEMVGGKFSTV